MPVSIGNKSSNSALVGKDFSHIDSRKFNFAKVSKQRVSQVIDFCL